MFSNNFPRTYLHRIKDLSIHHQLPTGFQKLGSVYPYQIPATDLAVLKSLSIEFSYTGGLKLNFAGLPPLFKRIPSLTDLTIRLDWKSEIMVTKFFSIFPGVNSHRLPYVENWITLAFAIYYRRLLDFSSSAHWMSSRRERQSLGLFPPGFMPTQPTDLSIRDSSLSASAMARFLQLSRCSLHTYEYSPDPEGSVLEHCPRVTELSLGLAPASQLETLILVSSCVTREDVLEKLIQIKRSTPEVQEVKRIELTIRYTDSNIGNTLKDVNDAEGYTRPSRMYGKIRFDRWLKKHLANILRFSCGYELVNMYNSIDKINQLGTICNGLNKQLIRSIVYGTIAERRCDRPLGQGPRLPQPDRSTQFGDPLSVPVSSKFHADFIAQMPAPSPLAELDKIFSIDVRLAVLQAEIRELHLAKKQMHCNISSPTRGPWQDFSAPPRYLDQCGQP
ncbi:hypothetical protein BJ165DRAFT_1608167 [Panaeolus papilionaceus]|nr:hypothetical protein BJ165DRAFT_1608167 [Panaeolus papilionaceus]